MLNLCLRTIVIYFALIGSVRIMGKRQIGELQVSEFIITVLLSEIAVGPISDRSMSLLDALLPIAFLLLLELLISFLLLKSVFLRRLLYGTPTVLISRGVIDQRALRRNRIELEELLSALRENGCGSIDAVRYAILEENGRLSVIPNLADQPLTQNHPRPDPSETDPGIAHPIILDGVLCRTGMAQVGWDDAAVEQALADRHLRKQEVFLMTVDDAGTIVCIRRNMR